MSRSSVRSTGSSSLRRVVGVALATGLSALAVAGCGVAEERVGPGVAARVGDTAIATADVDDDAERLCDMIDRLSESGAAAAVPGAIIRDNSLQYAVLRELGDQLAARYDVEPGELYQASIEQNTGQLEGLEVPEEEIDRVVPIVTSGDYFLDIAQQVGRQELGLTAAEDTEDQGIAEGLRIAAELQQDEGLDVSPRYSDIEIGDLDEIVRTSSTDLSVPVSEFATEAVGAARSGGSDTSYAEGLPESQRCG